MTDSSLAAYYSSKGDGTDMYKLYEDNVVANLHQISDLSNFELVVQVHGGQTRMGHLPDKLNGNLKYLKEFGMKNENKQANRGIKINRCFIVNS